MALLTPAKLDIPGRPAKDAELLEEWRDVGGAYQPGDELRDGSPFWVEDAYEIKLAEWADERLLDAMAERFLRYRFYPARIISPLGLWDRDGGRRMRDGDEILQRAHLLRLFGIDWVDVLAIVEVRDVIDEARRKGFSYLTSRRHAGVGIFHVSLALDEQDSLWLRMNSISRPAFGVLTRWPGIAHTHRAIMRYYQRRAHRAGIAETIALVASLLDDPGRPGKTPGPSRRQPSIEEGTALGEPTALHLSLPSFGVTAVLGLILWSGMMLGIPSETLDETIVRYVMLGVLVISPLSLSVLGLQPNAARRQPFPLLVMAAGLTALVGAFLETGIGRAVLGLPWLLIALWALVRVLPGLRQASEANPAVHPTPAQAEDAIDLSKERMPDWLRFAAAAYFVVGAAWIVLSYAGIHLGFGPTIARLTAVHFHFTGLGATSLAYLAWMYADEREASAAKGLAAPLRNTMAAGLLAGPPLIAIGISGPRLVELAGVVVQSAGILALATLQLWALAPRLKEPSARWLLRLSGACPWITMPLAMAYAFRVGGLSIPEMMAWHGRVNALGFVLTGLTAWSLSQRI